MSEDKERVTVINEAPVNPWLVVREGVTDVAGLVGALLAPHHVPGWEASWTAAVFFGVLGFHGAFKTLGKSKGGAVAILGFAATGAAWAVSKAPFLASAAATLTKIGKA